MKNPPKITKGYDAPAEQEEKVLVSCKVGDLAFYLFELLLINSSLFY